LRGGKTGDPRGAGPTPPPQPSADETRALQIPRDQSSGQPPAENGDATTAIPTPPRENKDPDTATEKLNAPGENPPRRRGGGLSAADLLRREGRM
jgi:RND superfamily putative drug exporter